MRRVGDFDEVRSFATATARALERRAPKQLTTEVRKAKRAGRLFLDFGRNAYAQHAVAPYSIRPRPGAPVATPLFPGELLDRHLRPERFTPKAVPERLRTEDDPWAKLKHHAVSLRQARSALDDLLGED